VPSLARPDSEQSYNIPDHWTPTMAYYYHGFNIKEKRPVPPFGTSL